MYKITPELVQGLLNYLATRPYAEVYQAVQALQSLEKIEEVKEEINSN
jgi:hypothetical protein